MRFTRSLLVGAAVLTVSFPGAALAATDSYAHPSRTTTPTGNDISWPQCGTSLPGGQAFGIVGVNDGLANNTNPCFATELAWALRSTGGTGQAKAAVYVNTANPGDLGVTDWPGNNVDPLTGGTDADPYGSCAGGDDKACAYQYGHNMAELDAQTRLAGASPAAFKWWLDVETGNSWEPTTANNAADLSGMVDYFQSLGSQVGLYSTSYQWGQIAGTVATTSSLRGLDSWIPGATGLRSAQANCSLVALTGGKTVLTQYVSRGIDYDYSCV